MGIDDAREAWAALIVGQSEIVTIARDAVGTGVACQGKGAGIDGGTAWNKSVRWRRAAVIAQDRVENLSKGQQRTEAVADEVVCDAIRQSAGGGGIADEVVGATGSKEEIQIVGAASAAA